MTIPVYEPKIIADLYYNGETDTYDNVPYEATIEALRFWDNECTFGKSQDNPTEVMQMAGRWGIGLFRLAGVFYWITATNVRRTRFRIRPDERSHRLIR